MPNPVTSSSTTAAGDPSEPATPPQRQSCDRCHRQKLRCTRSSTTTSSSGSSSSRSSRSSSSNSSSSSSNGSTSAATSSSSSSNNNNNNNNNEVCDRCASKRVSCVYSTSLPKGRPSLRRLAVGSTNSASNSSTAASKQPPLRLPMPSTTRDAPPPLLRTHSTRECEPLPPSSSPPLPNAGLRLRLHLLAAALSLSNHVHDSCTSVYDRWLTD